MQLSGTKEARRPPMTFQYELTYTFTASYKIREVMLEKSRTRRCAGDVEVPRQIRPIRLIPGRNTNAKNAGIVYGVLRVTTDTTDDMELALEGYFGDGGGNGDHPTPLTPPDSPCAALSPSLHAQHPSLSPERTPRSLSSKHEAPIARSRHYELRGVYICVGESLSEKAPVLAVRIGETGGPMVTTHR